MILISYQDSFNAFRSFCRLMGDFSFKVMRFFVVVIFIEDNFEER